MRVLVVEDEALIAIKLCAILDGLGAYVMETDTISEALDLLRDETFDLIVADVKLSDGTSDFLLEKVRTQHPDLPILMASGLQQSDLPIEIRPRVQWVRKPYTDEDIRAAVAKLFSDINPKLERSGI